MQKLLIILGLVIIPFYEIFLHVLPFVHCVASDSRVTKEIIALVFALSIGLLAVFQGTLKPFYNKFLLIIPVYLLFNLIMAPHIDLFINNNEVGDFYFWKPFSEVLIFSLMIIAIASIEIDFDEILKVMVICGFIMACYVILQKLGFDQFWITKQTPDGMGIIDNGQIGGNLGQKTIVASFIVMIIPIGMYLRKYFMCLAMTIAVIFTNSMMAIMAIGVILSLSFINFNRIFIIPILLIMMIGGFFIIKNKDYVISRMDGRSKVWINIYKDIRTGAVDGLHSYSITGVGLGRFSVVFPDKNKSLFLQAHNDLLEFIYDCGIFGGILLLSGIFIMIKGLHLSTLSFSILLSFITIFFCSLGSFPFQLGAHQFYSAVLVGLLHNKSIIRRV